MTRSRRKSRPAREPNESRLMDSARHWLLRELPHGEIRNAMRSKDAATIEMAQRLSDLRTCYALRQSALNGWHDLELPTIWRDDKRTSSERYQSLCGLDESIQLGYLAVLDLALARTPLGAREGVEAVLSIGPQVQMLGPGQIDPYLGLHKPPVREDADPDVFARHAEGIA